MMDRPALTLRTLTVAAIGVLLLAPEAVVHPSFQMSFAATLAIVAGYTGGLAWMRGGADTPLGARIALYGGREIVGLVLISLLAGFATTLYTAYHFHRLAPYGVIANLLAMPIVSFWVMPAGIAGLFAMPFGFDGLFWRVMGEGIEWMIAVALWVAGLPGAVGRITGFGTGPLLLGTAGLIVLGLLRTPLRFAGVILLAAAGLFAMRTAQPDVLVAADGGTVAVRTAAGRLSVVRGTGDTFAVRDWLAGDADVRGATDPSLREGLICDRDGCVARLADGSIVAIARTAEAVAEDCRRASVVVTVRVAPADCAALALDRRVWERHGAAALQRSGTGWDVVLSTPAGHDRPWSRQGPSASITQPAGVESRTRPRPLDATPRAADLEPGD
jgi:competence protein ComEC